METKANVHIFFRQIKHGFRYVPLPPDYLDKILESIALIRFDMDLIDSFIQMGRVFRARGSKDESGKGSKMDNKEDWEGKNKQGRIESHSTVYT